MRDQFGAEAANRRAAEWKVDCRPTAPAEIHGDVRQCFVEWHARVAETTDGPPFAERFVERLAERDAHVFGSVVLVDVQVAFGADGQVEPRVAREAIKHVVQEADTCSNVGVPPAIHIQRYLDATLTCLAFDMGSSRRVLHSSGRMVIRAYALIAAAAAALPAILPLVWTGFGVAVSDPVLAAVSPMEQTLSVRSPGAEWAMGMAFVWFALAYWRRRVVWWEVALVVAGVVVALLRAGNVWVLALAMIVPLARQLPGNARWLTLGAIGCAAVALVATFLARPPELSPSATVGLSADRTVLADWRWAPRVNAQHVYGAGGLHSESEAYWLDYLRVTNAHERWADVLRTYGVGAVVISADAPLGDELRRSLDWRIEYDANGALVAERTN